LQNRKPFQFALSRTRCRYWKKCVHRGSRLNWHQLYQMLPQF